MLECALFHFGSEETAKDAETNLSDHPAGRRRDSAATMVAYLSIQGNVRSYRPCLMSRPQRGEPIEPLSAQIWKDEAIKYARRLLDTMVRDL